MEFYLDKSRRDLVQKIARGVRFKGDMVDLWSPDVRVLNGKLQERFYILICNYFYEKEVCDCAKTESCSLGLVCKFYIS